MCNGSEKANARTRVLIVEDHFIVRQGLCKLLGQQPGLDVAAAVGNAREALEIARQEPFDLAIVDISLGEIDGIELTGRLKSEHSNLIVLILSMHEEALYGDRAAGAGASGFVAKQRAGDALLPAIDCVLRGEYYFSHP
ncbi:MAG: response regulator transcription factor [Solirubrobacterales bacterium]